MTKLSAIAAVLVGAVFAAPAAFAVPSANAAQTSAVDAVPQSGFFVGLQSGLISDSGLAPVVAGYKGTMLDEGRYSVTASGYYMYQTDWSVGTYVGGGLGAFNLPMDNVAGLNSPATLDFGYQGMAGVTYQFSPSMTLGLEYRYLGGVDKFSQHNFETSTLKDENQSVALRFDFSF